MRRLDDPLVWPVFIDESYTKDGIYFVAGAVVRNCQRNALEACLHGLLIDLGRHGISPDAEFHGYDIFHAEGDWRPLVDKPRLRIYVFKRLFEIMEAFQVDVYIQGVHQQRLLEKYARSAFHPHEVALHNLLCRLDGSLASPPKRILVVADKVFEQDAREARMAHFKENGTMGWNACTLTRVAFPFVWTDSRSHLALQLADVALFIHQRKINSTGGDERSRAAVCDLHDLMKPRLRSWRVWHPAT